MNYFNPLQWMKWLGQFFVLWFQSIPWSCVTTSVPAIVLTIALIFISVMSYTDGGSWRRNLVSRQLDSALQSEDFLTAELVIKRRIAAGEDSAELLYRYAALQNELDREDEAAELMRTLALTRRNDDAAMWLVRERYLGKAWNDLEPDERDEFGRLLGLLAEVRPKDVTVVQLYTDYLIASERYSTAIPYLRQLAETQPMRGLQAAALARRRGDAELADRLAKETLDRVRELFREEPANPSLAIAVVQNQIFLQQHADAVRTLNESISRMRTPEHRQLLQQAMGDTIVAWITLIESQKNETPVERLRVLKMLQVALQYAPNNPRVLTLVSDQVLKTLDDQNEEVRSLREALVNGTSPGIAHFVRGTAALLDDDSEKAERHLQLASKHLPNSSAILNNLAVALSQRENPNLDRALQLSEQAITSVENPGPYFYETRGQILFQLERYLDAIPDLERALAAEPLAETAHQRLASCYEKLEDAELAKEHRDAAERLGASPVGDTR